MNVLGIEGKTITIYRELARDAIRKRDLRVTFDCGHGLQFLLEGDPVIAAGERRYLILKELDLRWCGREGRVRGGAIVWHENVCGG